MVLVDGGKTPSWHDICVVRAGQRDGRTDGRALNVNARAPQELIALTDQTHLTFILRFVPAKQLREYP